MKRFMMTFAASALALVVVAGGAGFLLARGMIGPSVVDAAGLMGGFRAPMEFDLQGMANIPPAERFAHFLGGEMRYKDENNATHKVTTTPGVVTSASSTSITITPNEGGGDKTFTIDSNTRIHAAGQPWMGGPGGRGPQGQGQGQAQGQQQQNPPQQAQPKKDDKVVIVTLDGSTTAKAIMIGGANGFGPGGPHGPGGPNRPNNGQ